MLRIVLCALALAGGTTVLMGVPGFSGEAPPPPPPAGGVGVRVELEHGPVAIVDERFLSFAVDTAQVVGGEFWAPHGSEHGVLKTHGVAPYDFSRPALRRLASALAPAYLRIGGTDADRTVYRVDGDDRAGVVDQPRENGARWVLTGQRWAEVAEFARATDLKIMFTLNAGPSARTEDGAWSPDNARSLIAYTRAHGYPVDVWELGNEINAFPLTHGRWLSGARYAGDVRRARALLDELHDPGRLAGVGSAYWPVLGEGRGVMDDTLRAAGGALDIVTWHYYPQQSHRCPLATRRAAPALTPAPERLGDVDRWAERVEAAAHEHAPHAAVWLGETASAQCGGEAGVSDSFADALWWLDELGRMARRGQPVVVRQTLSGSDYGLVDDRTLQPNPSYWASWIWRNMMGTRVLDIAVEPAAPAVRAYAHCLRATAGGSSDGVAMLLLNIHPTEATTVRLGAGAAPAMRVLQLRADALDSRTVRLDGAPLVTAADGSLPAFATLGGAGAAAGAPHAVTLPPMSATFVAIPGAVAACR
jgi:heparanase 1